MKKRNREAVQSLKKPILRMSLLMKLVKINLTNPPQINQWTNLISVLYWLGAPWRGTLLKLLEKIVRMTSVRLGMADHATAAGPTRPQSITGRLTVPRMKLLSLLQEASTLTAVVGQPTRTTRRRHDLGQEADTQAGFWTSPRVPLWCLQTRKRILEARNILLLMIPTSTPVAGQDTPLSKTEEPAWPGAGVHTVLAAPMTKKRRTVGHHRHHQCQQHTWHLGTVRGPRAATSLQEVDRLTRWSQGTTRLIDLQPVQRRTAQPSALGPDTSRTSTAISPATKTQEVQLVAPLPPLRRPLQRLDDSLWVSRYVTIRQVLRVRMTTKKTREAPPLPLQQQQRRQQVTRYFVSLYFFNGDFSTHSRNLTDIFHIHYWTSPNFMQCPLIKFKTIQLLHNANIIIIICHKLQTFLDLLLNLCKCFRKQI